MTEAIAILFDKYFKPGGYVLFTENNNQTTNVKVYARYLDKGLHGFHIHESGDLSEHCKSLCAHYNPFNKTHGGLTGENRHIGDMGNLTADKRGIVNQTITVDDLPLSGEYSIIGRSVIIHQDQDDLGKGGNKESLKTGNAGTRLLCGVIGYRKTCK